MLQWMAPHPGKYGQYKLDSVGYLKKMLEVGRVCGVGVELGGVTDSDYD